jgi:hypothetical protein
MLAGDGYVHKETKPYVLKPAAKKNFHALNNMLNP